MLPLPQHANTKKKRKEREKDAQRCFLISFPFQKNIHLAFLPTLTIEKINKKTLTFFSFLFEDFWRSVVTGERKRKGKGKKKEREKKTKNEASHFFSFLSQKRRENKKQFEKK